MTELVQFIFSGAGVICIATVTLLWMRIRGRLNAAQRIGFVAVAAYALVATTTATGSPANLTIPSARADCR